MPRPGRPRKRRRKYTRRKDRFETGYEFELSPEVKKSILIISFTAVGGISLLSLFGLAGFLGEYIKQILSLLFGWGKILFPVFLLVLGFMLYSEGKRWVRGYTYIGLFFFILSWQSLLHIFYQENPERMAELGKGGGYIGLFLAKVLVNIIGFWAALLVIICLLLVSVMLIFNSSLHGLVGPESLIGRLISPITWLFRKIFRREEGEYYDGEEGQEDEDFDYDLEDEDAEYEEEEARGRFSSHEVKEGAIAMSKLKEGEVSKGIPRSNLKIDLPLDLLSSKVNKPNSGDIKNRGEVIKRTMENFGIEVEMGEVSIGPTVAQYTFKPADGVKLSRITGLSNDLALALAARSVRIEAPIPGKSLVGVEVPNKAKARVGLREILESREFRQRDCNTMIALGKNVAGQVRMADLANMPHLLVAGATKSGKSVCLHSIIVSLLYQNNPDDLKFILVDPKRLELPAYNGIPYLLTPVITDVSKTINALKWCLNEMDRRFDVLAAAGKRNIESYNDSVQISARRGQEKMPVIVFVIDELADLMVAAARDVEGAIIRLAQMARAVGIHLVLATQRPDANIITGLIKANIPIRIAFFVASAMDSRIILDTQGAEKLLGDGDMLFSAPDISKPKRLQGAYVDEKEVKRIVRYIKDKVGLAEYDEEIIEKQKVSGVVGTGFSDVDDDELYEEAKELIINSGKASTSFLQRRLRIGYARAARLIDLLEEDGVIGPPDGSKPREILITREEYDRVSELATSGVPMHDKEEAEFDADTVFDSDEQAREPDSSGDESVRGKEDEEGKDEDEDFEEEGGEEVSEEIEEINKEIKEITDAKDEDLPPVVDKEEKEDEEPAQSDDEADEDMDKLFSR